MATTADKMREQLPRSVQQLRRRLFQRPPTRRSARTNEDTEEAYGESKENADPSQNKKLPTRVDRRRMHRRQQYGGLPQDGPSVHGAPAEAADEHEAKPEGLGAQERVASQQPELVTGGKMRQYQVEGLEWLKSLWMNGLCGILADEMDLGKAVQVISMIAFFKEKNISGLLERADQIGARLRFQRFALH